MVTLKCSQQLKLFVIKFKLLDTLSKVYDGIDKSCLRCSKSRVATYLQLQRYLNALRCHDNNI